MRQSLTASFLSFLAIISSAAAQTPNGAIVPFATLPACAATCGPLWDVQGGCAPPAKPAVDNDCFCRDARLTVFTQVQNTGGVAAVCASCTAAADLTAIKTWYSGLCGAAATTPSPAPNAPAPTAAPAGATPSSTTTTVAGAGAASSPITNNKTWLDSHYKWVIMIVIIFVAIVGGWIGACLLRRRYIRKKERELEMRPPVAWGPHQMQGATGGYSNDVHSVSPSSLSGYGKEYSGRTMT